MQTEFTIKGQCPMVQSYSPNSSLALQVAGSYHVVSCTSAIAPAEGYQRSYPVTCSSRSIVQLADCFQGDALFDFSGTGAEVFASWNAPRAVVTAAVLYCVRCLVAQEIPLNQGCLAPIRMHIPKGTILSPSPHAAVVGGNVLVSQRIVDVIFKAFEACAASQVGLQFLSQLFPLVRLTFNFC